MLRCIHYLEIRQNPSGSKFNLFFKKHIENGGLSIREFFFIWKKLLLFTNDNVLQARYFSKQNMFDGIMTSWYSP